MAAGRRDGAAELGRARKALGLSIEQAAAQTRIPQRYLEALERGDLSVFPPGPFLSGYTRQYRGFLKLPDAPPPRPVSAEPEYTVTEPARPGRKSRRHALRLAVIGGLAVSAFALAVAVSQEVFTVESSEPGVPPDQRVTVKSPEPITLTAVADGREVHSGAVAALSLTAVEAHDRLVLEFDTLDGVILTYNNLPLRPLGATSRPRRLVFIDDNEPR